MPVGLAQPCPSQLSAERPAIRPEGRPQEAGLPLQAVKVKVKTRSQTGWGPAEGARCRVRALGRRRCGAVGSGGASAAGPGGGEGEGTAGGWEWNWNGFRDQVTARHPGGGRIREGVQRRSRWPDPKEVRQRGHPGARTELWEHQPGSGSQPGLRTHSPGRLGAEPAPPASERGLGDCSQVCGGRGADRPLSPGPSRLKDRNGCPGAGWVPEGPSPPPPHPLPPHPSEGGTSTEAGPGLAPHQ